MSKPLVPTAFLFRFAVPCRSREPLWPSQGEPLDVTFRLASLAEMEGRELPFEVRAAWSAAGLRFDVHVQGKEQDPWCRASRPEDSDGLQLWIDTRNVHNVHRASRFCHRFLFMPSGQGNQRREPVAQWLPINRAREQPRAIPNGALRVRSRIGKDGYRLEALITAEALTGFDPQEHPRLGFTYALIDRELGEHTFTVGRPMPYQEDPSLWATLELAD
jgi:hypothetical protein